jgi:hypothetical protein
MCFRIYQVKPLAENAAQGMLSESLSDILQGVLTAGVQEASLLGDPGEVPMAEVVEVAGGGGVPSLLIGLSDRRLLIVWASNQKLPQSQAWIFSGFEAKPRVNKGGRNPREEN